MPKEIFWVLNLFFLVVMFFLPVDLLYGIEQYEPFPIILVHGFNHIDVPDSKIWRDLDENFSRFFWGSNGEKKYSKVANCYKFNYKKRSNGSLEDISFLIKLEIDSVIYNTKAEKVIIVAHSFGGLVTRRFLIKYPEYKSKIDRVVFIGTPHLGSPLASGTILIKRMVPELERAKEEAFLSMALEYPAMNLAYHDRYNQIKRTLVDYKQFLNWKSFINIKQILEGDPEGTGPYDGLAPHDEGQGVAVGQMTVPGDVSASKNFVGRFGWGRFLVETEPITVTSSYQKKETFLNNNKLAVPIDFKIVAGEESLAAWLIGRSCANYFKALADFSGLPIGNTFADLETGDGVVTRLSQIGPSNVGCDYSIGESHLSETKDWKTILQAIEDKPEIESVYVVPVDWNDIRRDGGREYYIIIKVKDYFLADITVDSILLNGSPIIPDSFWDEQGEAKPYYAFGRDFLRKRKVEKAVKDIYGKDKDLELEPGEFYIKTVIPRYAETLFIRIRNPAAEYATNRDDFCENKILYFFRPNITEVNWVPNYTLDVPPYQMDNMNTVRSLSFNIDSSPSEEVRFNVWMKDNVSTVKRKIKTNVSAALPEVLGRLLPENQILAIYSGQGISGGSWLGEQDGGGFVPPYPSSIPYNCSYFTSLIVEPQDFKTDNIIPLLSNPDQPSTVSTDPTFIQASQREQVGW